VEDGPINPGGSVFAESRDLKRELKKYKRFGNHWKRYKFVQPLAEGKKVLDYGCGYGLGALILKGWSEFVGAEIDTKALEWARNNIQNIRGQTKFINAVELSNEEFKQGFDLILSFEVIEHVKDPIQYLKFLYDLLGTDGYLVISTPNGAFSSHNKSLFRSKFHVDEYNANELNDIIFKAGLKGSLYVEYRKDRLDKFLLRRIQSENQKAISESKREGGVKVRVIELFQKYLNSPVFYRIKKLDDPRTSIYTYSTILALISK
jgi:SAM-dependent methyltransferase